MKIHDLKCWPSAFQAVFDELKTFEYRLNDRDYQVGDYLHLKEWDPHHNSTVNTSWGGYTDRDFTVKVTYIIHGGQFNIPPGYCIMSVEKVDV